MASVLAFSATGLITATAKDLPALEPKEIAPLTLTDIAGSLRLELPASLLNDKLGDFNQDPGEGALDPAHDGDWANETITLSAAEIGGNTTAGTMDITPIGLQYVQFRQDVVAALNDPETSIVDFSAFLSDTLVPADVKDAISSGSGNISIANINQSLRAAIAQDVGTGRAAGNVKMSDGFQAGDFIHVPASETSGFKMGFTIAGFDDPFTTVHDHSFAGADNTIPTAGFTPAAPLGLTMVLTN